MPSGEHPNSRANLIPVQPGQVLNPQGINRKRPYSDRHSERAESPYPETLRRKLNQKAGEEIIPTGATWADAEVAIAHLKASHGGTRELQEITDRIEGKPPQRMEIVGTERKEVTLRVVFETRRVMEATTVLPES
jgi:hypothetical protein